jgi:hypothetical protein
LIYFCEELVIQAQTLYTLHLLSNIKGHTVAMLAAVELQKIFHAQNAGMSMI